jgi:hypothetical protein
MHRHAIEVAARAACFAREIGAARGRGLARGGAFA